MDLIEIKETFRSNVKDLESSAADSVAVDSVEQALDRLLKESKGYPKQLHKEKILTHLYSPSLDYASDIKSLGGSYWVSKESLFNGSKLKVFAQGLLAEPADSNGSQGFSGASRQTQWTKKLKCYYVHSQNSAVIGLPRFWALGLYGPPKKDLRSLGLDLLVSPAVDLRPLQCQAVEQSLPVLQTWGGCTIIADCGFGKTRLALGLISRLGRKAMVLCNRDVLMLQWATVFEELMPALKVSWIQGTANMDKKAVKASDGRIFLGPQEPCDICICSIETLIEGLPKTLLESFGTLVVDECHHLAAATLMHAVPMVPARYVVGLSATPDRRDGLEHVLYWLLGPTSFVYKRLPSITGQSSTVEVRKLFFDEGQQKEKYYMGGQMAFAEMLTFLSQDPKRNKLLLDTIIRLVEESRTKIIVVSGLVDHCCKLKEALEAFSGFTLKIALMAGPNVESAKAKDPETKVVLATYSLLEEGYDDPDLDTLVLATPRSRIQQTVGRIERTKQDKLRPLVVDLVDSFSVYPAMFYKRKKFYTSRGFLLT